MGTDQPRQTTQENHLQNQPSLVGAWCLKSLYTNCRIKPGDHSYKSVVGKKYTWNTPLDECHPFPESQTVYTVHKKRLMLIVQ